MCLLFVSSFGGEFIAVRPRAWFSNTYYLLANLYMQTNVLFMSSVLRKQLFLCLILFSLNDVECFSMINRSAEKMVYTD
jgi:hypothetical protein